MRCVGICLQLRRQFFAAHAGHHNVEQKQVVGFQIKFQSVFGAGGRVSLIAFHLKICLKPFSEGFLLIYYQYFTFGHNYKFEIPNSFCTLLGSMDNA